MGLQGIALGDANGDGLDDLSVCQAEGFPNLLYVQNPDGTLRDESASAGVDWMGMASVALFADLDNDGDQDLIIVNSKRVMIQENDGSGEFKLRARFPTSAWNYSIAAADYDNDCDLDMYICGSHCQADRPVEIDSESLFQVIDPVPCLEAELVPIGLDVGEYRRPAFAENRPRMVLDDRLLKV